jgi:uncharacterized MAPEG superfamily protein
MTTELWYLFLSSIVLAVLWIPYIIGVVKFEGQLAPEDYTNLRENEKSPVWVKRANRAHLNMVEQFGAFAGLVLVAHAAGISTTATAAAAAVFFWARIVHALIMLTGFAQFSARTLTFTLAFFSLMVIAFEIARKSI